MEYLDGDNDLSESIQADFNEIMQYAKSDKINICVQMDLTDGQPTKRYCITNGAVNLMADPGELDMTKSETPGNFC